MTTATWCGRRSPTAPRGYCEGDRHLYSPYIVPRVPHHDSAAARCLSALRDVLTVPPGELLDPAKRMTAKVLCHLPYIIRGIGMPPQPGYNSCPATNRTMIHLRRHHEGLRVGTSMQPGGQPHVDNQPALPTSTSSIRDWERPRLSATSSAKRTPSRQTPGAWYARSHVF